MLFVVFRFFFFGILIINESFISSLSEYELFDSEENDCESVELLDDLEDEGLRLIVGGLCVMVRAFLSGTS